MANQNTIIARRDGREKVFPQRLWDIMPAHKYGWEQVWDTEPKLPPVSVQQNLQKATKLPGRKKTESETGHAPETIV